MPTCKQTIIENIEDTECLRTSINKINNNFDALNNMVCTLRERMDASKQIRTFFYYGPNAESQSNSGMDDYQLSRPSNMTIEAFVNSPSQLNVPAISNPGDVAYVVYQKTGFNGSLPTVYSGFNTAGQVINYSAGRQVPLQPNRWYNVDDYFSASASTDGGFPKNLGTITLTFKNEQGKLDRNQYTARGQKGTNIFGDDTYIEWTPEEVISYEGYPIPKTVINRQPRPFKNLKNVQFMFEITGSPFSYSITSFLRKPSSVLQVSPTTTLSDLTSQFSPTFIIWRLVFSETQYYVETGFPKFTKGFTSNTGQINPGWNDPRFWTKYESWT